MTSTSFRHVARLADLPSTLKGAAIAIGNFDGMHRGHQAVIARLIDRAEKIGVPAMVLTFEPHPRTFFCPNKPVFRLTPSHVKGALGEGLGLDGMASLHFDAALASLPAEDFVRQILVEGFAASHVVIGHDCCFGAKRAGDHAFLRRVAPRYGFTVDVVEARRDEHGAILSSSRVRDSLSRGRVSEAAAMLGRPWSFEGRVERDGGPRRGSGYPTANIGLRMETNLAEGIYAVVVDIDGVHRRGVATFGYRRHPDDGMRLFEIFVLDFSGDLRGKTLSVWPIARLRSNSSTGASHESSVLRGRDIAMARAALADVDIGTIREPGARRPAARGWSPDSLPEDLGCISLHSPRDRVRLLATAG